MKTLIMLLAFISLNTFAVEDGRYKCYELHAVAPENAYLSIEVKENSLYRVNFIHRAYLPKGSRGEMVYSKGSIALKKEGYRIEFKSPKLFENRFGIVFHADSLNVEVPGAYFNDFSKNYICD